MSVKTGSAEDCKKALAFENFDMLDFSHED